MSRPAANNGAEEAADLPNAVFRPPLGDVSRSWGQPLSGLSQVFLSLSDVPKAHEFRRCICFEPALTVPQARFIGQNARHVVCPELTSLEPEVAEELAACEYLDLPALAAIVPATAAELANVSETLKLPGLTSLNASSARALAQQRGHLNLSGLVEFEPGVAATFATHEGSLILDGLEVASFEDLKQLARHTGPVYLARLPPDTPGLAEAFAEFRYPSNVIFSTKSAPPPSER